MDLSALIFVALAVAWATYLIPKALRQHEESSASRSVEGFSARMRVLARREPVDSRSTRLVVEPGKPASTAVPVAEVELEVRAAVPPAARRAAAARAARRRMRVVQVILGSGVVVGGLVLAGVVGATWLAAPGAVLLAWLVACRLMVKRERAVDTAVRRPVTEPAARADVADVADIDPVTEEIAAVRVEVELAEEAAFVRSQTAEPQVDETPETPAAPEAEAPRAGWDPVPTTLPTYVDKAPAARRTVRTIDLDATGVWTSGPLASDSALAREADAERQTSRDRSEAERRAFGS